jgi:ABC-type bacteriocin/lantibiotic exporter with double-glycine peptidase domain
MNQLAYLRTLVVFAFRENPLLYLSVGISILSVMSELAAMASLLPLASLAAGQSVPGNSVVVRTAMALGIVPDGRALMLIFVGLFAFRVVTQFSSQSLTLLLSKRMLAQLATRAFSSLVSSVPLKQVEKASIGSYITLVGDESFRASNLIVYLTQVLASALLGCLYFAAIFVYSPIVALGVLVFLLVTFACLFESFRLSHRLGARQIELSNSAGSLFLDSLNGLRSVRAFSAEAYVTQSYRLQMWQYMRTLFSVDLLSQLTRLGPALLLLAALAVVAAWPAAGARLSMDFPFVVTIVIFLLRFFPVVGQTLTVALRVIADARAGRDVTHLIRDYEPTGYSHGAPVQSLGQVLRIQALGVRFSHDDEKPVLKDLDICLERGNSYALLGLSGSGKSTFLDLLMGFYAAGQGRLLINGIPLEHVPTGELRKKVLLVSQDATIFNDTVLNNVRFGAEASMEEVARACRLACIDDFIATLPQGYDTLLSYRGTNFSGGQRQRIGIARAILRRPDVLLLDESTSALDSETSEKLVCNLLEEFADRIVLFVTHDAFVASRVSQVLEMAQINKAMPGGGTEVATPAMQRKQAG